VRRLESRFALPVDVIDEHLTSWEASQKLTAAGVRSRGQKAHTDALAACVIFDCWFEARRTGATLPVGETLPAGAALPGNG
jgi:putative holliday junction resolvase